MHAYDLSRLQKPVEPSNMSPMNSLAKPPPNQPNRTWDELPQTGKQLIQNMMKLDNMTYCRPLNP